MIVCSVCFESLLKDQKLAVLSSPVRCINDSGDYSFLGDFTQNEKIFHYSCFTKRQDKIYQNPMSIKPINNLVRADDLELFHALIELGEDTNQNTVKEFVLKNPSCNDISDYITKWFKDRNKVV